MHARSRLLVIGNGMVGQRFLESLPIDCPLDITVVAEESRPAYDRVQLSAFFSGKTAADLSLVEPGFFAQKNIALKLNERAVSIDCDAHKVRTSNRLELEYDILVLALGSYPFVPPIPGRDRSHCHVYRTIEDLEAIRASSEGARVGAVVGGGLLGLEAAKALRDLGLETNVVEFAPRLMALQVDEGGGGMLRRKIEALGVRVHTGKNTKGIEAGEGGARHSMSFSDGSSLETDVIVFSAGIRPRDDLAREAGLKVGERGGIVIDDYCQTSDPNIYAIGECALWRGRMFGLVAPGYDMARVAALGVAHEVAANGEEARTALHVASGAAASAGRAVATDTAMPASASVAIGAAAIASAGGLPTTLAQKPTFTGADMSTKLKLLGVGVASIGDAHAATPGARAYSFIDERREVYKKLVVTEDGSKLLGAVLVGDTDDYGAWLQTMLNSLPLPEHPEDLILPPREGGGNAGATG
ncbi:MAG TPA: FAD-dependent oxidoreductase, partial [Steroidobacteraceae bacterium]|nr:FAD-dependent oxidoreductase [Steroidobacteraceae bacterium]